MATKVDMNDRILIVTSIFAHRGHHVRWPENSAAAVADARDLGVDGVEIDVWLTGDKDLIVNHDRILGGHDILRSTRAQLEEAATFSTLRDVLDAAGELRVNVEIKSTRSDTYNSEVARAVSRYLDDSSSSRRCMVSSFSLTICQEVRRLSPGRKVGWLVTRQPGDAVLDQVDASRLTSAHFPFARVSRGVARRAAILGIELHVWTPNLERDLERMLELGVGGLSAAGAPLALALRERHERTTDQ